MKYNYTLIRSNRKTLSLEITRELEIIVRSPKRCKQKLIESFICKHEDWIESHLEKQRLRLETHPVPTADEREALFIAARDLIPPRVNYFAGLMGLSPEKVTITGAEHRFGSCSAKNNLCFSYRLAQYPQEAIDYVVVHELSHIVHKNHGSEFYALIASVLPDYKKREKLLK